ncbi:hypothetical protein EMM73_03925 [Rheinheimera sediminis]|uniref:hypothetical protein n=1 Tax=Rheinheimera sp. YQF-1 TaxID=2499626 RepID=UPI000FDBA10E|nr:hypothetical protein [Rheinheimera sp. YQF-1]RVT47906.1 hypothetical protein EMM73_03925 [Rheinheimera sp. YQF-1]
MAPDEQNRTAEASVTLKSPTAWCIPALPFCSLYPKMQKAADQPDGSRFMTISTIATSQPVSIDHRFSIAPMLDW